MHMVRIMSSSSLPSLLMEEGKCVASGLDVTLIRRINAYVQRQYRVIWKVQRNEEFNMYAGWRGRVFILLNLDLYLEN